MNRGVRELIALAKPSPVSAAGFPGQGGKLNLPTFSPTFQALLKEAQFTREMLGSGATQIRKASYASKGIYFQAFTSLSTGLERIGKLCLMLDYYIDHGRFPDPDYMKDQIRHKITVIYEKSVSIVERRSISLEFLKNLNGPIHQAILKVLSEFAQGDRYSNIDLLVGAKRQSDPTAAWHTQVDQPIFNTHVSAKKKETIRRNADAVSAVLGHYSMILHTSETGDMITDMKDGSYRTGMYEVVAPYRQLYVLQVIRYWTEIISSLQYTAKGEDISHFGEGFALFYNNDSYMRTRK